MEAITQSCSKGDAVKTRVGLGAQRRKKAREITRIFNTSRGGIHLMQCYARSRSRPPGQNLGFVKVNRIIPANL